MNHLSPEERRQVVEEEMIRLKREDYISDDVYETVTDAERRFYNAMVEKNEALRSEAKAEQVDISPHVEAKAKIEEEAEQKPLKEKKQLSAKEVRERNITWLLNLGVILLLIGGLVLATSTWDVMSNWAKTGLIALVAVLFFGLAYFTRRVLKIEKTGFAFHILGSLFLPIVILSAGYFELFGPYFSYYGEGRFLFGAAGSFVILPVYVLLAARLASRLFIWFSYVTISISAGFLIAALHLPADGFYLGIMIFNAVLILAYTYFGKRHQLKQFTKEFPAYIQANLIMSTLLMLLFYQQEVSHGFNMLLTAVLYFAMIFVTNHKNYHFVFSAMLVYGAYQLIEFSVLNDFGPVFYALLGFIFIAIPMTIRKDFPLKKAFQYTSAVVSGLAFLYISLEGMLLRMEEASLVLMLAYIMIALNFTYLTTVINRNLFRYLSPVFFIVALYEGVLLAQNVIGYQSVYLPEFLTVFFLYIFIGCLINLNFFKQIKSSTRDVSLLVMFALIYIAFMFSERWVTGTMLLLISILAVFMDRFEKRSIFTNKPISAWIHAITLGFSITMYYAAFQENSWINEPFSAGGLAWTGVLMLPISWLWRKFKKFGFYQSTFFAACGFYAMGIIMTFLPDIDPLIRIWIALVGIGIALLLYRKVKETWTAFMVSALSLFFYLTVLYAVDVELAIDSELYHTMQFATGAFLLLVVGSIIGRRDKVLRNSFWWMGHLYLPFALLYSLLFYGADTIWAFAFGTVVYGLSVKQANEEWRLKTFLYAAFTSFWLTTLLAMTLFDVDERMPYAFLATSAFLGLLWQIAERVWRKRITYYAAPFSALGILAFTMIYPFDILLFIVTLVYIAGLLFVLQKEKWDIVQFVPLGLTYSAIITFSDNADELTLILLASFGILISVIGYMIYPVTYQDLDGKEKVPIIDWFSIIGLITFASLYSFIGDALWTKLLPGLLISIYLIMQRNRVNDIPSKWIVFAGCLYLLQPYYALLGFLYIPELIEMDLYVLPWIIPAILLKKVTDNILANRLQWVILLIVALLLIIDGLNSNTIYDGIIVGSLSLISILAGMKYQIKSFFFVGAGVLLLNVFMQTRPYWGNLPWWIYLLIAGSILITLASYNEWHKQKTSDGKDTFITTFKRNVVEKIKKWE